MSYDHAMSYDHSMSYDHNMSYDHSMSYDHIMSYDHTMSYAYNMINEQWQRQQEVSCCCRTQWGLERGRCERCKSSAYCPDDTLPLAPAVKVCCCIQGWIFVPKVTNLSVRNQKLLNYLFWGSTMQMDFYSPLAASANLLPHRKYMNCFTVAKALPLPRLC